MAVDDELHYGKNGGVVCGVSLLRLNASDFLFYPITPPGTLYAWSVCAPSLAANFRQNTPYHEVVPRGRPSGLVS